MTPQEQLARWVRIESLSGQEDAMADEVVATMSALTLTPQRQGNNVWASVGSGPHHLLLISHIDTVKPGQGWAQDPWHAQWQDGKLVGLGSNDAKGCALSMLLATASVRDPKNKVTVLLVAEEETGGSGGVSSVLATCEGDTPFTAAVVGEPTQTAPCTAQRGMLGLRVTSTGVMAHVGHPHRGDNAIHRAARDITRLQSIAFEPHDVLGVPVPQVTMMQGGIGRNQIPDRCEWYIDIRTTPKQDHATLTREVQDLFESDVVMHTERYQPCQTPPGSAIERAAIAASHHAPFGSRTVSDWCFLGEIPAVKAGPGDSERSHTANEFIFEHELLEGIAFYQRCIDAYELEVAHG